MNVVTTLPGATELVAALGVDPVGVSHECDYPPRIRECPSVTRSRIDDTASSGEIDRQVSEAVADSGVYDVDVETLDALEPDLIVTQGMCDVCAVDTRVVEAAISAIDADPVVLTIDPHSLEDVLDDLQRIGRALGREVRAATVRADLEARVEAVQTRVSGVATDHPRVVILDWTDPPMVASHWTAELVEVAGGEYGLSRPGERSRPRAWAEIREYDPEVLIVAPCGFDLEQTAANLADLTERDGWTDLSAVDAGLAWAMDGHHYLNRPGPRLVDTLEYLAGLLHPEGFDRPPEDVALPVPVLAPQGSTTGSPPES